MQVHSTQPEEGLLESIVCTIDCPYLIHLISTNLHSVRERDIAKYLFGITVIIRAYSQTKWEQMLVRQTVECIYFE